ncbi:MAG: citrate/2-methylcitrate synthase [Clostridiales bacterium]|nr:citrate/2-methylcitrate synthase [Clostridiales bacterium]
MNEYSAMTPEIQKLAAIAMEHGQIPAGLYDSYHVLQGLRDVNGKGVLAGLTDISTVKATKMVDGKSVPCKGELRYRGYDVKDLIAGFASEERFGFEEMAFLLIFGRLPQREELQKFQDLLGGYRTLPTNFVRDVIMKAPGKDMMNTLQRGVLTLYSYDDMADNIQVDNVLRQCLQLISTMPMLAVYGYQAYNHYVEGKSFYIHSPKPELSTAENILRMLRPDKKYTKLEARILDIALVLHMDHGGGNNSTFTNHVVTSSGTDTYSAMAASLASLKGPKHGGANLKVVHMFDEMKEEVKDWEDEDQIRGYLIRLLNKEAFDHSGLIYGMGHAVYSISDPRAEVFKGYLSRLAREEGYEEEFAFYDRVERLATELISKRRKIYKGVSVNIDFYSGFMYRILGLPDQLFTPMFATARIVGWSAHRIEELMNCDKIIRPAYQSIAPEKKYIPMDERTRDYYSHNLEQQ